MLYRRLSGLNIIFYFTVNRLSNETKAPNFVNENVLKLKRSTAIKFKFHENRTFFMKKVMLTYDYRPNHTLYKRIKEGFLPLKVYAKYCTLYMPYTV